MGLTADEARHGLIAREDGDRPIGLSLERFGEWAEEELYFLSQFIVPGAVVLDVGANVGTHALAFSRFVTPTGRVFAIDAQEQAFDILVLNMLLNAASNVSCIRALAGRESRLLFVPTSQAPATGLATFSHLTELAEDGVGAGRAPLPMVALDDLALVRCDLIKIDVEAMELDVLLGAGALLKRHRPVLYFEQTSERNFAEIVTLLQGAAYQLFWHVADPFNTSNYKRNFQNIFGGAREVNVLGLPAEKVEVFHAQASGLQLIDGAVYEPPGRFGTPAVWALPEDAYQALAPVTFSPLAQSVARAALPKKCLARSKETEQRASPNQQQVLRSTGNRENPLLARISAWLNCLRGK